MNRMTSFGFISKILGVGIGFAFLYFLGICGFFVIGAACAIISGENFLLFSAIMCLIESSIPLHAGLLYMIIFCFFCGFQCLIESAVEKGTVIGHLLKIATSAAINSIRSILLWLWINSYVVIVSAGVLGIGLFLVETIITILSLWVLSWLENYLADQWVGKQASEKFSKRIRKYLPI